MFTGIIECLGSLVGIDHGRVEVQTPFTQLGIGESVAVDGVCLTVIRFQDGIFAAEISEETARRTTVQDWKVSQQLNIERPMPADGRFGGHIVQGHVDTTSAIAQIERKEGSVEVWFELPQELQAQIVEKGSIAIDGISLTVAALDEDRFMVSLVPHTLEATALASKQVGSGVNIEVDIIGRYVERMMRSRR